MDERKAKLAYQRHKNDSGCRGIKFEFTYLEWVTWWIQALGPDWQSKRGHRRGQFVMARRGDVGPYAAHNVRCVPVELNHAEYNVLRRTPKGLQRPRIDPSLVVEIYKAKGVYADIAKRFGVGAHQVHCIKTRKYYRKLTEHL